MSARAQAIRPYVERYFPRKEWITCIAVALAESDGRLNVVNQKDYHGDPNLYIPRATTPELDRYYRTGSFGAMQVAAFAVGGAYDHLIPNANGLTDQLYNPDINFRLARQIWDEGGWDRWGTYEPRDGSRPRYLDFLDEAKACYEAPQPMQQEQPVKTKPAPAQAPPRPVKTVLPTPRPIIPPTPPKPPKKKRFTALKSLFKTKKMQDAAKKDGLTGVAWAAANLKEKTDAWIAGKSTDAHMRMAKIIGTPQLFHTVYERAVMDIEVRWPFIHEYFHETIVGSENTIILGLSLLVIFLNTRVHKWNKGGPKNPAVAWVTRKIGGTAKQAERKEAKDKAELQLELAQLKEQ